MADKQKPVFSIDAEFELKTRSGQTVLVPRFPTDDEWSERNRSIKTMIVKYGKGSRTVTTGVEEAEEALLARLLGNDSYADHAGSLMQKLMRTDADDATAAAGNTYEIKLTVVGGIETVHTLRVPSEREMRSYRKGAFAFIDLRHGKQELKSSLSAIGEFYDLLVTKVEGYLGDVPLAHKSAVVIELTATVDALDAEEDPENF
jgi:hypothetical protein